MIGQGRPHPRRWSVALRPRCRGLRLAAVPARSRLLLLWLPFVLASGVSSAEVDLRLRVAWGGAERTTWSGAISVEEGQFSDLVLLGIENDEPGSIWLDQNTIRIDARTRRDYGGVDISLAAPAEARLVIRLQSGISGREVVTETDLGRLVSGEHRTPLDSAGNFLVVSRAPGDRFQVEVRRSHMVYAPGEAVSLDLTVSPEVLQGHQSLELVAEVARPRGGEVLHTQRSSVTRQQLANGAIPVALAAPREEGVFDARLVLRKPPGIAQRIVPGATGGVVVQRQIQFVVLDRSDGRLAPTVQWDEVAALDLANPNWSARVPAWVPLERLPGVPGRPLSNVPHKTATLAGTRALVLPSPTEHADRPWYALPVSVERRNVPHMITVDVPADQVSQLGLTILEPNAAGFVYPISRDFGTFSVGTGVDPSKRWHTKHFLFWPKSASPMLLFTNEHPSRPAYVGDVRLYRGEEGESTVLETLPTVNRRTAAVLLDRPWLVESIGAPEVLDPASQQSVDDWQTFYIAASRLVQYVQMTGYNAAILTAFADGSTIYPSTLLSSTPRYDTGVLATSAQDPLRKDFLELLLSLFDRAGLSLYVGLEFATPLPELERLRRETDPQRSGIEWIGADGRTWAEHARSVGGAAPHYNLLNERVQEALLQVVREVATRYERHPALAGIALQLSGVGYAHLLEPEWGFDDATIAQFERDTGIQVPGSGLRRFSARADYLLQEKPKEWIAWRAGVVSGFYKRLAEEVRVRAKHRNLVIVPARILDRPEVRARLRPSLPNQASVTQVLLELGIAVEALAQCEGVIVLRPTFEAPPAPITSFAAEHVVNGASGLGRVLHGEGFAAHLSYFPSLTRNRRLLTFDQQDPFGENRSFTAPLTQMRPLGHHRGRALARALAESDAEIFVEGGQTLVTELDDDLRRGLEILRKLPTGDCERTVRRGPQPITIRTYHTEADSFLCVINESPWTQKVVVVLEAPAGSQLLEIGTARAPQSMPVDPARMKWPLELGGYGIRGARISAASARVVDVRLEPSATMQAELKKRKAELDARALHVKQARPLDVLENGGFELAGTSGALHGWQVIDSHGGDVELVLEQPIEGDRALRVSSLGPPVSVASNSFSAPVLGQLAITAHVRRSPQSSGVGVLMIVEDALGGALYRSKPGLLGVIPDRQGAPIHTSWGPTPYKFTVTDVPIEAPYPLRVRFEVVGAGAVWIDDVAVSDESLEGKQRELAIIGFEAGVALDSQAWSDCLERLDGFWPQYLAARVPLPAEGEIQGTSPEVAEPSQTTETEPSVADRIKRYVPQWLQ